MRTRGATFFVLTLIAAGALAQAYQPPRTTAGHPDLQGVWTNASLTRINRPREIDSLVLTPDEAAELAGAHFHNVRAAREEEAVADPDREAPDVVESLPPVGNYNAFWVDPGTAYAEVKGEIRSSWIVEPADGQVPLRPEAQEQIRERRGDRHTVPGPEARSLGERCLLGFGGTAGPPMLNVLYNGYYRIVQTPTHVVILVEMVHDARIVRLDAEHGPAENRRWLGDSVGRWDGDTLVIETTSFHPERAVEGSLPYSASAVVTERITRVAADRLLYEFTVDDPAKYSETIRGEMTFRGVEEKVFEYACHEGNYAMGNILRGARRLDRGASAGE